MVRNAQHSSLPTRRGILTYFTCAVLMLNITITVPTWLVTLTTRLKETPRQEAVPSFEAKPELQAMMRS